jgi:Immunity protein 51
MFMLKIDQLKFPPKLRAIIADEGSYEDDSFAPLLINVSELGHKGRTMLGYQLILRAGEHFEEFEDLMYDAGQKIDGDSWEVLIRKYLKTKDAAFEKQIEGDTEGSNCVLWAQSEDAFRKLLGHVTDLLSNIALAKALL